MPCPYSLAEDKASAKAGELDSCVGERYNSYDRRRSQVVRRGSAKPLCTGSIPVAASRVVSSAEERLLDVQKVGGSNPPPPTRKTVPSEKFKVTIFGLVR
jgi:hypothetical protein